MKRDKIRRIALAAALATTMLTATPQISFAQSPPEVVGTIASQVKIGDYAASRTTIKT